MTLSFVTKTLIEKNKVYGKPAEESNQILLSQDDDLTQGLSWSEEGFTLAPFLQVGQWIDLFAGFKELFESSLESVGIQFPETFAMEDYHKIVQGNDSLHLDVIEKTRLFRSTDFPMEFSLVEQRISEILGLEVQSTKPFNGEKVFHLRVIRPSEPDYNPIHRDVWQSENKDAINIYVPLVGSNEKSSLKLVPQSHKWPESATIRSEEGAEMNGLKFNVPGLISSKEDLNLVVPNPAENEVLIFSPYLLHGLSSNENDDETRISLEMRFWRANR